MPIGLMCQAKDNLEGRTPVSVLRRPPQLHGPLTFFPGDWQSQVRVQQHSLPELTVSCEYAAARAQDHRLRTPRGSPTTHVTILGALHRRARAEIAPATFLSATSAGLSPATHTAESHSRNSS